MNKEKQSSPFVKCLNPKRIQNKYTHDYVIVKCGKCYECLAAKALNYTNKCKIESQSHRYTYFVTLTYAPEYVPTVDFHWDYHREFWRFDVKTPRLQGTFDEEDLYAHLYEVNGPEMFRVANKVGISSNSIPFVSKRDVQLFMKRLRKCIKNEKIRYFLSSEYGELHYRPHYHLLLWFEEEQTAENLHSYISSCWPYGRIDVQQARNKCAHYVAGYVNSFSSLPKFYRHSFFKPFNVHSRYLAEELVTDSFSKKIAEDADSNPLQVSIPIGNKFTDVVLWRSLASFYMPKCANFSNQSDDLNVYSYRTYEISSRWCKEASIFRRAREIADEMIGYPYMWHLHYNPDYHVFMTFFYKSISVPCLGDISKLFIHSFETLLSDGITKSDLLDRLTQSVYRLLSVSKRFYDLKQIYKLDSWSLYDIIKDFYGKVDSYRLKNQYESFDKYLDEYGYEKGIENFLYADLYDENEFLSSDYYDNHQYDTAWMESSLSKNKRINDRSNVLKDRLVR